MNKNPHKLPRQHGGKREGAGRKPDWLKEKCQKLIEDKGLLLYLANVGSGEETEKVVIKRRDHYEIEEIPCSTRERLNAIAMLMDRGYGKASQPMTHDVGGTLEELLTKSWSNNG